MQRPPTTPMPGIVYGTAWKKHDTTALVVSALRAGFRGVDTACQPRHYHEPGVGEALAIVAAEGLTRDQLFIQTKFTPEGGQDEASIPYDPRAPLAEQVAQSFAVSQRNLGTAFVDSLVLHSPLQTHAQTLEVWRAMEALHDSGGALRLGISNCYDLKVLEALHTAARVKPSVLQNRFYAKTGYDGCLRAFCGQAGITYQSFWTLTANPEVLASAAVGRAAQARGATRAQVLFAHLMAKGIVPLTGTRDPEHMAQDLAALELSIGAEEAAAIDALLSAQTG